MQTMKSQSQLKLKPFNTEIESVQADKGGESLGDFTMKDLSMVSPSQLPFIQINKLKWLLLSKI